MIHILDETLIPFRHLPKWCEEHLGNRVSPSTLHRWRLRGVRGVKLETILIGGKRHSSVASLQRFFDASTRAQDGQPTASNSAAVVTRSDAKDEAYLTAEGFK